MLTRDLFAVANLFVLCLIISQQYVRQCVFGSYRIIQWCAMHSCSFYVLCMLVVCVIRTVCTCHPVSLGFCCCLTLCRIKVVIRSAYAEYTMFWMHMFSAQWLHSLNLCLSK